jgi:hypothetical protein
VKGEGSKGSKCGGVTGKWNPDGLVLAGAPPHSGTRAPPTHSPQEAVQVQVSPSIQVSGLVELNDDARLQRPTYERRAWHLIDIPCRRGEVRVDVSWTIEGMID